jgi:predicted MFS family arabinose efflux permease
LALFSLATVQAGRVFLSLYALKLGAQPFAVGILVATFSVLPLLLSWQVGKLADRFGSRWPLMFGTAGGALGMLVPYFFQGMPALFIAAVTNGLLLAFSGVAQQNLIGLLSAPEDRSLNFSNFSLVTSTATFIGPLLAGFSIDHAGYDIACLILTLMALVPMAMLAIWGGGLPRGTREAPPAMSVREMLTGSGLWRVLTTSSLLVSGISLFQFYMPIYGHDIGLSASAIGVVLAVFSGAAFFVRLILPKLFSRWREENILAWAFFIGTASLMLLPFFKSAVLLSLVSFLFGLGMGCGQPITMMLTFSNSAENRSGEVLGLRITANHLARMVGPVVFGAIGAAFGMFTVFWLNAAMLASGGMLTRAGAIRRGARKDR